MFYTTDKYSILYKECSVRNLMEKALKTASIETPKDDNHYDLTDYPQNAWLARSKRKHSLNFVDQYVSPECRLVLDAGCGAGAFIPPLIRRGKTVVSIDFPFFR
jgi:2-polyprenyl-3-methyl-5-hydroxy-6-metoxy-1,4-benzoquinol methylase